MRVVCLIVSMMMSLFPPSLSAATYEEVTELKMERSYAQKLQASGRYDEAMIQAQRVLQMSQKLFGEQHRDTAMSLDTIASILRKLGRYEQSEQYFLRALEITRQKRQEQPSDYAAGLQNLAGLYREIGRYNESEQLYHEAITTLKGMQPIDDEAVLSISGNLAILYENQGRYAEAEPILRAEYEWALKAAEPDSLSQRMHISMDRQRLYLADRMSNLAGLYLKMRRDPEAIELTSAALAIKRQILNDNDPGVAREMNNLGMIYSNQSRYQQAEPLLRQAVDSARKIYGNHHPELATYLDNLAMLYQRKDDYKKADQLHLEAVAISTATLGNSHPNTLMQRNNLAVSYLMQNRYADAERVLRRLVADSRSGQAGVDHPELAIRLSNLADAVMMQGNYLEGYRLQAESLRIREHKRDDLFLLFTEQQKLQYLRDEMMVVRQHLAVARQVLAQDPGAAATVLDVWLRWKGIVMESQGRYLEALYMTDNPDLKRQFDELVQIRRQLAGLRLVQPAVQAAHSHAARIELLDFRKEKLEITLSRSSAGYAKAHSSGLFGIEKLRRLLSPNAAYIDFALVEDWRYQPLEVKGQRYLVFIATGKPGSTVQMLDLGPSSDIDQAIRSYRRQIADNANSGNVDVVNITKLSADLYHMIMAPLLPYLKNISSLTISPDGALHLLPFEVLRGENQSYLLEQYAISYVGSGRDMVRFGTHQNLSGDALIMADPDYDLMLQGAVQHNTGAAVLDMLKMINFTRLPDTKTEAVTVAALLKKVMPVHTLTGAKALESSLFAVSKPRILHLATHGFFFQDEATGGSGTRGLKAVFLSRQDIASPQVELVNPMLRSGIALAGVNRSLTLGRDDGLVTAEKILGLRLLGTELVTLSACETGVGDVKAGEGVFGLKRAFILAGAKTLLLTLWSVPSRETTELMSEFYRLLASGSSKQAALNKAQRVMLKKYPHPFYWGAFQLVGSPD